MKIILIILISLLIFTIKTNASIEDCTKFNKLSVEYLECKKNNLLFKSEKSGLTTKFENFKSSKTLTEFFKKNRNY